MSVIHSLRPLPWDRRRRHFRVAQWLGWWVCLCLVFYSFADADEARRVTLDDLGHQETIDEVALSPDGSLLLYVVSTSSNRFTGRPNSIWLVPTSGGQPRRILDGTISKTEYRVPTWSPDSKRIAMLSITGVTKRLAIWNTDSNQVDHPTEREIAFGGSSYSPDGITPPISWITDRKLVCAFLKEGYLPDIVGETQAPILAVRAWSDIPENERPHLSVLQSGAHEIQHGWKEELAIVDLDQGIKPIGSAATFGGGEVRISPDHRLVAFLKRSSILAPKPGPLSSAAWQNGQILELVVAGADDGNVKSVRSGLVDGVENGSVAWSANSHSIAYVRQPSGQPLLSEVVLCEVFPWSCELALSVSKTRASAADGTSNKHPLVWADDNNVLVYATKRDSKQVGSVLERADWWLIPANGPPRNLTAQLTAPPAALFPETGRGSAVIATQGALWRISWSKQAPPQRIESGVSAIIWPRTLGNAPFDQLILQRSGDATGEARALEVIDLNGDHPSDLSTPPVKASLVEFSVKTYVAVFRQRDPLNTSIWLSDSPRHAWLLAEANHQEKPLKRGRTRIIEYRSLDGLPLKAWLLSPPDSPGERACPLVTSVYAGAVYDDHPFLDDDIEAQVLASYGYCVLFPSMPLEPAGEPSDPYLELPKGVLPAIDRVIQLGLVDPKRLAVMGHSYGGYSTLGLITQTDRFRAAVSSAGTSDLLSIYGTFTAMSRYSDRAHQDLWHERWVEQGQGRMAAPPWKDLRRYLRNSPIIYANRVKTPLLIIHSDMDSPVPIQQSEEFFTALYRQNKRAEFVRYWGEGHGLTAPENIRDKWQRILAWFDEFLDISRDEEGNLVWSGRTVKSRAGASPLKPEDFARFEKLETTETPH